MGDGEENEVEDRWIDAWTGRVISFRGSWVHLTQQRILISFSNRRQQTS